MYSAGLTFFSFQVVLGAVSGIQSNHADRLYIVSQREGNMELTIDRLAKELSMPEELLEQESARAYLEKQWRNVSAEILSICQKYGASSWQELNQLIIDEVVEEGKALEDFQRVDHLTAQAARLKKLLEEIHA
jgi:hypothetical protein